MVSSDSDDRERYYSHRRRRSRERDRSRSRSRGRIRNRSADRDFRPHLHSRSRSRERWRSYRSRSRSRERFRRYSPDRPPAYERPDCYYDRADSPPPHWAPGAGGAGQLGGELPPWRAGHGPDGGRHMQHDSRNSDGIYPIPNERYDQPNWPPHDQQPPPPQYGGCPVDGPPYYQHNSSFPEGDWSRHRSREHSSGLSRGGSESEWDMQREIDWQRRFGERENPTASIFIKGLPEDAEEADLYKLFEGYPNLQSVKVLRDRMTGRSKGMAFVDFATSDDARVLMESEQRWSMNLHGRPLMLDYSHTANTSRPTGAAGEPSLPDWICDMCSTVNFARRLECYHCSTARPANPRRVVADLNEPSNILKISGLELNTSEEGLFQFLAAIVPNIVDMRVIKDKYTGAPRGFAFVECPTIAEAGLLMIARQGKTLPGQSNPLKICYAKAKEKLLSTAESGVDATGSAVIPGRMAAAAIAGVTAGGSAATEAGPLGWKPKEFDATAVLDPAATAQQNSSSSTADAAAAGGSNSAAVAAPQQQQQAVASAVSQPASTANAANTDQGSQAATTASASAAAAAAAGVDAATIQAMTQAGFEYQPSSGYWYDPKSGYYYDAKTQLYYHHSTSQWYRYDHSTGQYSAVSADQQQQQQGQQKQTQAVVQQQATVVAGVQQQIAGVQQQQQQQQQQQGGQKQQLTAAEKRRRAAIGSAPQYNKEGLLAAAALAKEREEEQKRLAAAKAARERQQQQQKAAKQHQPQLMQGKPGIGALPGTGAVTAPAAPPAAAPAAPAAAQVVADGGKVLGVVYKSKWAQRQQR